MTHPSHLHVRSRTPPGPRRRWSTPPTRQCHQSSVEEDTHAQGNVVRPLGQHTESSFHTAKDISAHTDLSPVLRLPYITWSQSYFTVFIILHFMCFPPPQIIVFLHPPHSAPDYLSALSSSVVHNQWPQQALADQQCPGF